MQLKEFFEDVYSIKRLRGKSKETTRLFLLTINSFAKTLDRPPVLADLNEPTILKHLARRRKEGKAPATLNKELSQLLALARLAYRLEMMTKWLEIQDEPEPQRTPLAWMPDEIDALLKHIGTLTHAIGDCRAKHFWGPLVRVILDTGERIGAVRRLKWENLHGNWLNVPAEVRKGGKRDKPYLLSDATVAAIKEIPRTQEEIFHWPLHENYFYVHWARIVEGAGLQPGRKSGFHRIRKTVASAVYAAGQDPTEALDHSDRRTTQAYLDPRLCRETHVSQILADYLANPSKRKQSDRSREAS